MDYFWVVKLILLVSAAYLTHELQEIQFSYVFRLREGFKLCRTNHVVTVSTWYTKFACTCPTLGPEFCITTPHQLLPCPPIVATHNSPLCISSSKRELAFDVQTLWAPVVDKVWIFSTLVNSLNPTGSPPLPSSSPSLGRERDERRTISARLQTSAGEGAIFAVAAPCSPPLFWFFPLSLSGYRHEGASSVSRRRCQIEMWHVCRLKTRHETFHDLLLSSGKNELLLFQWWKHYKLLQLCLCGIVCFISWTNPLQHTGL